MTYAALAGHPPAPIAAHALLVFLLQAGVLLLTALGLGRLAVRCRMPAVVGELCAGILVGPTVLGHVAPRLFAWLIPATEAQYHLLDSVGQVGLILLVGVTGIEIDLGLVRRRGTTALRVGVAGLLIPLALGVAAGRLVPSSLLPATADREVFALFIGVAMCVSALPVIAKTLSDMRLLHRDVGQLTIAAGIVDDVVGWLILSIVSAMAIGGTSGRTIGLSLLYLAGILAATVTVGRLLVRTAFAWAERTGESGPPIALAVITMLLMAAATQAVGLEASFGGFLAGLVIGSTARVRLDRLAPLRASTMSVFAPLFFATAGLRMDLTVLGRPVVLLAAAGAVLVAVAGKFAGAFLGALSAHLSRYEALALGAGMNARGVIQIVVATVGLRLGVLDSVTYTIVVLVAIVTSVMAPPILRWAMARVARTDSEEARRLEYAAFRDPAAPVERPA